MPIFTSRTHRQERNVMATQHFQSLPSRFFDRSYVGVNSYQEKYIYSGMILAQDSSTEKYVPYNSGAAYGTGSDTAVGVLRESYDMTYDEYMIEPVWHGMVIQQHCYVYGGAMGTVPAAVKTSLSNIKWV